MLLGVIADDFTGASDIANTLAKGGMVTIQFVGVPTRPAPQDCEAGVVALKTRSIAADEAVAQSLAALEWLKAQGCEQFLFKYCSTFDSTPEGNIGPVAEALLEALGGDVAVVCPAFPTTGRTLYQGHLFVNGRLLSESGMETHPLNPMTDPDLVRWLGRQTSLGVGLVPYPAVRAGAGAIRSALAAEAAEGRRLAVADAIVDDDLFALGEALDGAKLITGGSGVALGLPRNFAQRGLLGGTATRVPAVAGPGCVLSGSCSTATRGQVARYAESHPALTVLPEDLVEGRTTVAGALDFVESHLAEQPIVTSTAEPEAVAAVQERFGRARVAEAVESFFGELASQLVARGVSRIAVGGGETSGAVITALHLDSLRIGGEIDPGVPALVSDGDPVLGLALKSGNFGAPDFFDKALRAMETP